MKILLIRSDIVEVYITGSTSTGELKIIMQPIDVNISIKPTHAEMDIKKQLVYDSYVNYKHKHGGDIISFSECKEIYRAYETNDLEQLMIFKLQYG